MEEIAIRFDFFAAITFALSSGLAFVLTVELVTYIFRRVFGRDTIRPMGRI